MTRPQETRSDMPGYSPQDEDRSSILDTAGYAARFLVRNKDDANAVRTAILEAGLFPDEMRMASELARGNVPPVLVVDIAAAQGLESILDLSERCRIVALAHEPAHELEALRCGAAVALRSPINPQLLTLYLKRFHREAELARERSVDAERESVIARAGSVRYVAQSAGRALREPITAARLNLELLADHLHRYRTGERPDWGGIESSLQDTRDDVTSVSEAIAELEELGSFETGRLEPIHLKDPVRKVVAEAPNSKRVPIEVAVASDEVALARADVLTRVLTTLVSNALHSVRSTSDPRVRIRVYGVPGESRISVRNNGKPISSEARMSIFEPFFSRPGDSDDLVGLALCRDLVARMGGALTVAPGTVGACFRVRLRPA